MEIGWLFITAFALYFLCGLGAFFLGWRFAEEPLELKEAAICALTFAGLAILFATIQRYLPHWPDYSRFAGFRISPPVFTLLIMTWVLVRRFERGIFSSIVVTLCAYLPVTLLILRWWIKPD